MAMALKWKNNSVNTIKYSGRNLQPIKDWSQRTINGVTCSIKDGVGYLNGTSTAGSWQQTEIGTIILPAGTYTIYFWTNFVQTSDPQILSNIGLGLRNSAYDNLYICNTNKYRTFTLTEQQTFNIVFWWKVGGIVFDNIWIKSMVRPGTYDASTEYDQYGIDTSNANLINYKSISSSKFTDLGNGSFKLNWGGGATTITLPYSSFKTNTQYSFTLTSLNGAKYWAYNLRWNYSDGTNENFTSNQGLSYGTYSYTSAAGKTLTSITWVINFEADFYGLMLNEGQPKSYADNDVKMLEYNGDIVWCKPYIFTLNKTGSPIYSCSITSVEEPTASTGSIVNGSTIYYNSAAKFKFTEGSENSTSSTTSPSSVTAPVVTSKFTGSLGATIKNNNNFSVKAYYYIHRAGTRVPSSGYNSTTIAANTATTITGLASASYANQTTIYVYFSASATVTNTTTTTTYSGSVTGLRGKSTTSTPLGNLDTITIIGIVDDAVTFNVSKTSSSSVTSTSSTTINSTTKSCGLGYA